MDNQRVIDRIRITRHVGHGGGEHVAAGAEACRVPERLEEDCLCGQ